MQETITLIIAFILGFAIESQDNAYTCPPYCEVNHEHHLNKIYRNKVQSDVNSSMTRVKDIEYNKEAHIQAIDDILNENGEYMAELSKLKHFSQERKAEYDKRNWAYDETIDRLLQTNNDTSIIEETVNEQTPLTDFERYIIGVEGDHKEGKLSVEGDGTYTIGYGRKLKKGEVPPENVTDADKVRWLREDLATAEKQARNSVNNRARDKHTTYTWDTLDDRRKNMLIDFVYNTGKTPWILEPTTYGRFSKFGDAILSGDEAGMRSVDENGTWAGARYYEDKSTGEVKEIDNRNSEFKRHFGLESE